MFSSCLLKSVHASLSTPVKQIFCLMALLFIINVSDPAARLCNMYALQNLYDPQSFADRIFEKLTGRKNEKFEVRLLNMALCARVIGLHKLQTLGFYSHLHRYLQPKQREVGLFKFSVMMTLHYGTFIYQIHKFFHSLYLNNYK